MVSASREGSAARVMGDRTLYGLRVRSALPLPDLLPWTGPDRSVDLHIRLGPVPERLADPVHVRPLLQVGPDGECRFALPSVAAFLISPDGREVVVDAASGAGAGEVRTFLLGTVLAVICHRRGLLPLHACCVRVGGWAVAFAGDSGAGKSTLALGLRARGFSVLADDVTVLDMSASERPLALPAFPRLRLWRDVLERQGHGIDGLEEVRPALGKYHLPVTEGFCADPLPLAGLVLLEREGRGAPEALSSPPLPAPLALEALARVLYRPRLMLALETRTRQMSQYLRLLAAVGGLRVLRRPESREAWARMEAHLRTLGSAGA